MQGRLGHADCSKYAAGLSYSGFLLKRRKQASGTSEHIFFALAAVAKYNCFYNSINLKLQLSKKIPVIFHNLRGYDSHHIMQCISKISKNIKVIPNNMEKYLAFSIGTERKEFDVKNQKICNKDQKQFNIY